MKKIFFIRSALAFYLLATGFHASWGQSLNPHGTSGSELLSPPEDRNETNAFLTGSCANFGKDGAFYKRRLVDVPNALPMKIREFMRSMHFGYSHDKWHTTHSWDNRIFIRPGVRRRALCSGWERFPRQMGQAGSGLDFLAMHRLMVQMMRDHFPEHAGLFAGWQEVPVDPNDPDNQLPYGLKIPFTAAQLHNLNRLKNSLGSFESEDQLGLFFWTNLSKPAIEIGSLHLYLHTRWSDFTSDVNLADEVVNIENIYFWRLQGWIDRIWSDYRQLKGLTDTDPTYQAALQQANLEMAHH